MRQYALETFSFYLNYDYGRHDGSMSGVNDNEAYVKHIVDTFYKNDFGKIVNVHDMTSERGRFFIITFNKETFNWSNPMATSVYTTGFPTDSWGLDHITIIDHPVAFKCELGHIRDIFLTSFPDIDEKPELFGEWRYDIIWTINEYDEEYETFEIKMNKSHKDKSDDNELSNSVYCVDENDKLSCKCGGCPNLDSDNYVKNEIVYTDRAADRWKYWGGDNTRGIDDDTQIAIARENDINRWLTEDQNEQRFYENWAAELDELSMKYCGNSWGGNNSWKPIVYRYDLADISYTPSLQELTDAEKIGCGYTAENGYTAYTNKDFIDYYGKEDGKMRWNSNIYSATCTSEGEPFVQDPPEGCKFKYNISYLILKLCSVYNNEDDFNIARTILRKYVDVFWSFTDPTDDVNEKKPVINLRADYNTNVFNLSCFYDFKYTNLKGGKLRNIERLIMNLKSHQYDSENMLEWVPSAD
jgi:hypothetical protein